MVTTDTMPDDLPLTHHKSILKVKAATCIKRVQDLLERSGDSMFLIGGILYRAKAEGWYKNQGYKKYADFVEQAIGLHVRKAQYWVDIYSTLMRHEIPFPDVKHVGWTKLQVLCGVIDSTNYMEWITWAEPLTVKQVIEGVREELQGDVERQKFDYVSRTFKLHDDQVEIVEAAINGVKTHPETETEFDNVALERLCTMYMAGHMEGYEPPAVTREQVIAFINQAGIRKTKTIIKAALGGKATLERATG